MSPQVREQYSQKIRDVADRLRSAHKLPTPAERKQELRDLAAELQEIAEGMRQSEPQIGWWELNPQTFGSPHSRNCVWGHSDALPVELHPNV